MSLKARIKEIAAAIPDDWREYNTLIGVERLITQIEQRMELFKDRAAARDAKIGALRAQELRDRKVAAKEAVAAKQKLRAQEKKAAAEAELAKAEPPKNVTIELGNTESSMDVVTGAVEIGKPSLGVYETKEEAARAMQEGTEEGEAPAETT